MEHSKIITLLTRRLAGEATPEELRELKYLLKQYPEGIYYEETFKQLWKNPDSDSVDNIDELFSAHRLKYATEFSSPENKQSVSQFFWLRSFYLPIAATIILALSITLWFYADAEKPSSLMEIVSGSGVRKTITLPDGTKVWLNSSSKIKFDAEMNVKSLRKVYLSGEAFFDVKEDKKRPFVINTDRIVVKVLGTAFNVKAYPGEKTSEATLIRGVIELNLLDRPEQKIILKPNEKFALKELTKKSTLGSSRSQENRQLVIENIKPLEIYDKEYLEETSWIKNQLVFKNQAFQEIIPKLERWYNVKFQVKNPEILNYYFTGVFEKESLEQALSAMQLVRPFKFSKIGNEVILK